MGIRRFAVVVAVLVGGVATMGAARAPEDRTLYLIAPDQAPIGHTAVLEFQARGITSPEEAADVALTLTLPDGMTYVSPEPYAHNGSGGSYNAGPCTPAGQIVTCRVDPDLLINSTIAAWTATVGIGEDVAPGTRLTVRVAADGKTMDATTTAVVGADLTVRAEPPRGPVTAGRPVEYTVIVRNNGPGTIKRFTLFESLEGRWYVGGRVTHPDADCFADPGSFICDVYREVKPGEEVRLRHSMPTHPNADTWGTRNRVGMHIDDFPSKIDNSNDSTSFVVQFAKKPPQTPSHTPSPAPSQVAGGAGGGSGSLPITGPATLPLTGIGVLLLLTGAGALRAGRSRRQ